MNPIRFIENTNRDDLLVYSCDSCSTPCIIITAKISVNTKYYHCPLESPLRSEDVNWVLYKGE